MKLALKDRVILYDYVYLGGDTPEWIYDHYSEDMPYGIRKARSGDPDNWLADNMHRIEDEFCEELESEAVRRNLEFERKMEFQAREREEAYIKGDNR